MRFICFTNKLIILLFAWGVGVKVVCLCGCEFVKPVRIMELCICSSGAPLCSVQSVDFQPSLQVSVVHLYRGQSQNGSISCTITNRNEI